MIELGLIGYPLEHSWSKDLHEQAMQVLGMEGNYHLWEAPPSSQGQEIIASRLRALREGKIDGFNVTIPHKETLLSHMDRLTQGARAIAAVNTVFLDPGGEVVGENTDGPGFWADVHRVLPSAGGKKQRRALILGAGGAARAVAYALSTREWEVGVAARRVSQAESLAAQFRDQPGKVEGHPLTDRAALDSAAYDLIVNATPVGMDPDAGRSPWPDSWTFPTHGVAYDLVYNPPQTPFLQQAEDRGLKAVNGLGMLVEQAALAFECWTGVDPPREEMLRAVR